MTFTVVVPTIREDCAVKWLANWKAELKDARVIMVEDNPEPTFDLPGVEHYAWNDVTRELGNDAWIIPRRTSACRSFGFLKALDTDSDIIWTTDDDCYPEAGRRGSYIQAFTDCFREAPEDAWFNTLSTAGKHDMRPRGYPYRPRKKTRQITVHHGLWSGTPDLDGLTQLANPEMKLGPCERREVVPTGKLLPFCIMNVAFKREMTPAMYMLLMGQDLDGTRWGFDRFDDIWGGVFVKKICDKLGLAVSTGSPSIFHSRASNPHTNARLEAAGIEAHEDFWQYIDNISLRAGTVAGCYQELAYWVGRYDAPEPRSGYWRHLGDAMKLFSEKASILL